MEPRGNYTITLEALHPARMRSSPRPRFALRRSFLTLLGRERSLCASRRWSWSNRRCRRSPTRRQTCPHRLGRSSAAALMPRPLPRCAPTLLAPGEGRKTSAPGENRVAARSGSHHGPVQSRQGDGIVSSRLQLPHPSSDELRHSPSQRLGLAARQRLALAAPIVTAP